MDLNLREISYFLKIAELGTLSGAAAVLSISQSALSRALKRLEERLGGELFVRHTLGADLTAYGEAFLAHARILQADADRTVADLTLLKGASKGVARVGIVPSAASFILPPAFESALRLSPNIQIHVVEAASNRLVADLEYGNVDFAIASPLASQHNENIQVTEFLREEMFVVCRRGHPMSGKPCELADVLNFPWIVPEKGNAILIELRKLFMRAGVEPPVASVSSNSVHTLKATLVSSDFLTMLPAMAFQWEKQNGILETIDLRGGRSFRHLCVLRRVARPLLPAANLVLSEIRKFAKSTEARFKLSSNPEERALVQSHTP